ncbi:MAG: hypothetical protein DCC55_04740 [Chloroflexi bacterium]|nr:MAG: hypothetical protein DCC55_04740 [Chloroflexota bacterium]
MNGPYQFRPLRNTNKFISTILVGLILLAGSLAWRSGDAVAQELPGDPTARPTMTLTGSPQPHITTSGAVGTAATFQLSQPLNTVSAALAQSQTDWQPDLTEDFENGLGPVWQVLDESGDGFERHWGINDYYVDEGAQALWVASGGADALDPVLDYYPPNLDTWLITANPIDLSNVQMADVDFSMFYDTEVLADYAFVGASVDGENFYGQFWTGDSGGFQTFSLDLSEFIGYPQVYIGFYFHSDDNASENEGVWLDDITIWTYVDDGPPQGNESVQNGNFETGELSGWTVPDLSTVIVVPAENPVNGEHVAFFGGIPNADEMFYQALALPDSEIQSATVGLWVNLFGEEIEEDADYFCSGIYDSSLTELLVDLGCLNGVEALIDTFEPANWWQAKLTLSAEQWQAVRGRTVNLAFEMYTDDSLNTTVYIDDVTFEIVTGGLSGDRFEPNDTIAGATTAQLATPLNDLSIHQANDIDYFKVVLAESGSFVANLDAANTGSPLDAIATLVDGAGKTLCENNDDGQTVDPYLMCEVEADTYYVRVASVSGQGGRNYTYAIQFDLATGGNPPPTPPPPPPTPEPPPSTNPKRAWTAILYINGDNNLCNSYLPLLTRMEQELGGRIGPNGFLYVTVLIDLDPRFCNGQGGTTRYLIQPGGNYTDNVNRWNMGELNMGDGQTLVNFANWAMQNYPADNYYLAVDNHGGGVSGISWDDTNDHDNIDNAELHAALKEITRNGTRKLALFAYEACLMAMYENAYDLRNFTDYIFGFSTISWTNNASYPSYLGDARFTANTDARTFGDIMFDVYFEAVTMPYAVSLVESSKMQAVHDAVNLWATALINQVNSSAQSMVAARSATQKIDTNNDDALSDEDRYLDLWHLADRMAAQGLAANEAAVLKQAIEAAAVRKAFRPGIAQLPVDYANTHGLSIFWPRTPAGNYEDYVGNRIYNSTREGQWDEFLQAFFTVLPNGRGRGGLSADLGAIDRRPADSSTQPSINLYLPLVQR